MVLVLVWIWVLGQHMGRIVEMILVGDSATIMQDISSESVDLIVTSPPYDGANTPKGEEPDLLSYGEHVARVLKKGGVAVVVIQDLIHDGVKRGMSLRLPIHWIDCTSLNLWDDYIYWRGGQEGYWWQYRIRKDHDYMWVFVNDSNKPNVFNKPSDRGVGSVFDYRFEKRRANLRAVKKEKGKLYPVPFPFRLAEDMIRIFTNEGDLVLDPFCGYGTTLMAAKLLNRRWMGIELLDHVARIAEKKIKAGLL